MENKIKKINISKTRVFQFAIALSSLLVLASVYSINNIQQKTSSISRYESLIKRETVALEEAKKEIEAIDEEFKNAVVSYPLGIDGRVSLIVRDIKRIFASNNIDSNVSVAGSQRGVSSNVSLDSETGLKTISFNADLEYERYSDLKDTILKIRNSFPLTIDKLMINNNGTVLSFTVYGE